ncbi:hypothetical protein [Neobacillus citreus]|uniref:Uncharacterized protein n=1 Tax=Neobacillus citreus TaxID=2833578 RepID=A0A942T3X5_9BACI|nr:hypothetical protein [Neobacillus citreus]MCH6266687.1 hypothetical protein [Neobacillus citreus]
MQMIIWAFGSMLLTLLVLTILRIGLTLKGKLLIALAAFVIALGGNAAISTFPLWQTALMLLLLIFLIAYVLDARMGPAIYQKTSVFADEFDSLVELEQPGQEISAMEIKQQDLLPKSTLGKLVKASEMAELNSFVPYREDASDIKEENISFLLDRETEEVVDHAEILDSPEGYMSELESLLELETQVDTEPQEVEGWDKIPDHPVEIPDEALVVVDEEAPLDDALLEFLSADREEAAAVHSEDTLKELELDKKLSLSK